MNKLQEDFNQWAKKNNLKPNLEFSKEHQEAYVNNKAISITKDDKNLLINKGVNGIQVSYTQSLEIAQQRLSVPLMNDLLDGKVINIINETRGEIKAIKENNVVSISNEKGVFDLQVNDTVGLKVGDKISLEADMFSGKDQMKYLVSDNKDITHSESLLELNRTNLKVVEINPEEILNKIVSLNNIELTKEMKEKLKKGEEVNLDEETTLKLSPASENKFKSNQKAILIASMMLDGGLSYLVLKAVDMLRKAEDKKHLEKLKDNPNLTPEVVKDINNEIKKTDISVSDKNDLSLQFKDGDKVNNISQDDIYDIIIEKLNKNEKVQLTVANENGTELTVLNLKKDDLILKDREVFQDFLNQKNPILFEQKDFKQLSEIVQKTDVILKKQKEDSIQNNFENYLKAIQSVLQQKARAYPEEKGIINDINILSKNISVVQKSTAKAEQHKKGSARGTADPDMFEDAKVRKEKKAQEMDEVFHPKKQKSRGMKL